MVQLNTHSGEEIYLNPFKISDEGEEPIRYDLMDESGKVWMELRLENNSLHIERKDDQISDTNDSLLSILDNLVLTLIESAQSGTDGSEAYTPTLTDPYDPDSIKVQTKAFSLSLISSMIDKGYIDLAPDFQRNFVWDNFQKSRLIESILLRIPLPMFYFAEDEEGNISVVDGLQRLTTIKEFMENKFPLRGLEYLSKTCGGCYYNNQNDEPVKGPILSPKYQRWFDMTQLTVNVIDPSSPTKVKYDIFRRINTGGKPLNNQEIRNCLASKPLRAVLLKMAQLPEFKSATDWSIKNIRLEDIEVALRFICFYRLHKEDPSLGKYNGNMENTLDVFTEQLGKMRIEELDKYVALFSNAMKNSEYLFGGKYAFRKISPKHLEPGASKKLINKALFVSWAVLLSQYDPEQISSQNPPNKFTLTLANRIDHDRTLYNYLSFGTNGKANLQYAFWTAEEIIIAELSI